MRRSVTVASAPTGDIVGDLTAPGEPCGLVIFAHGSGSSRHSTRNRAVAEVLEQVGFATLLLDLLTADEERLERRGGRLRFDVDLLAARLQLAERWSAGESQLATLPVGYFGASTGAGAALVAAARQPDRVAAVVSRGGRPDLAGDALDDVRAPTLLIVGGLDHQVLELNRAACARFRELCRIEIVAGASHLFEEPGALDAAAALARDWFVRHLRERGHEPDPS
jgi:pimeloyl-ACP methyl ester carboxylesterase